MICQDNKQTKWAIFAMIYSMVNWSGILKEIFKKFYWHIKVSIFSWRNDHFYLTFTIIFILCFALFFQINVPEKELIQVNHARSNFNQGQKQIKELKEQDVSFIRSKKLNKFRLLIIVSKYQNFLLIHVIF